MKSPDNPLVYIVLVNYNGWTDTIECLESLYSSSYRKFKIIVVDNASGDESVTCIEAWAKGDLLINENVKSKSPIHFSTIRKPISFAVTESLETLPNLEQLMIFKSNLNLGFAGGNNIGIKIALSDSDCSYIWLLNNDTVIDNCTLAMLVAEGIKLPNSILGNKLLYYDKPDTIQALAGKYNKFLGLTSHIGGGEKDTGQYDNSTISFDYLIGASLFVPIKIFDKTGLLEEDYFLYFEELDFLSKAKKNGFTLNLAKKIKVFHKEGSSIKGGNRIIMQKSRLADFYYLRNKILFTYKFHKQYLPFIYLSLLFSFLNRIKRKQYSRAMDVIAIAFNPKNKLKL